jgi:hypothetical protein
MARPAASDAPSLSRLLNGMTGKVIRRGQFIGMFEQRYP